MKDNVAHNACPLVASPLVGPIGADAVNSAFIVRDAALKRRGAEGIDRHVRRKVWHKLVERVRKPALYATVPLHRDRQACNISFRRAAADRIGEVLQGGA